MLKFFNYFEETMRNFNLGMLSHVLHRITGVALSFYIIMHLYTLGAVRNGASALDESFAHYDNLFGHCIEYLLLLAVLFHTFNGIRIIVGDFWGQTKSHKQMLIGACAIAAIIAAIAVFFFFPELHRA
jgi:succinate dehydrogenase / fumarate reductase, cytochrome b subunit